MNVAALQNASKKEPRVPRGSLWYGAQCRLRFLTRSGKQRVYIRDWRPLRAVPKLRKGNVIELNPGSGVEMQKDMSPVGLHITITAHAFNG
jgi:hypothetical protein